MGLFSARLTRWRRDISAVVADFRGERRPLVERPTRRREHPEPAPRSAWSGATQPPSGVAPSVAASDVGASDVGASREVAQVSVVVERRVLREGERVIEESAPIELVVRPGESILEAADALGVRLPSSCRVGGCDACMAEVVSGDVSVPEPHCLTDEERARGVVLPCIAVPRGVVSLRIAAKRPVSRLASRGEPSR